MKALLGGGLALALWAGGLFAMHAWTQAVPAREAMSTPPSALLRMAGAGFEDLSADVLYLQFVDYFGHHIQYDHHYENMAPAISAIVALDPHFLGAYHLGSLALGDSHQYHKLQTLWDHGIAANPGDWRYPYNAGMDLFLFGHTKADYLNAARYFKQAAADPGATPYAAYMQARMYAVTGQHDLAVQVWLAAYAHAGSPQERAVAARSLQFLGVKPPEVNAHAISAE